MGDRNTMFAWTFSLVVGSIIMLVLNVLFYGSNFATVFLAVSTAINAAFLSTTYRAETLKALKKLFWW
ncbi:hypothetical protein [Paenibacillus sp. P36]|uniref:hypothetical protein n=1 Tax=Paenibacillus sp. P36 TaxID=3342538 RepID=UPI0038B37292